MTDGAAYLKVIKKNLDSGKRQWRRGDKLLEAFGYVRRRQTFVDQINSELDKLGLIATPPITPSLDLSGFTGFTLKGAPAGAAPQAETPPDSDTLAADPAALPPDVAAETAAELSAPPKVDAANPADLSLTVRNLECSEMPADWISPDATLVAALTEMQLKDYSQLVVAFKLHRTQVKGVISYKSVARAQLLGKPAFVRDCLDESAPRVNVGEPLLDVITHFKRHDIVLVFDDDNNLSFVVTPPDISTEFRNMAGPFLIIGEIEEHLRWFLERCTALAQVIADRLPQEPVGGLSGASELTMGDVQWILQNPQHWASVGLKHDRGRFCIELDHVRQLRNTVMHFRDPVSSKDLDRLRSFADLLRAECAAAAKTPITTQGAG